MLQSPHTNAALRRMSEQAVSRRFEDAECAWEATKARKDAKIQVKARRRAKNKDAQLQAHVMGLVV